MDKFMKNMGKLDESFKLLEDIASKLTMPVKDIEVSVNPVVLLTAKDKPEDFVLTIVPKTEVCACNFVTANIDDEEFTGDITFAFEPDVEKVSHRLLKDELVNYDIIEKDIAIDAELIEKLADDGVLEYDSYNDWKFNKGDGKIYSSFTVHDVNKGLRNCYVDKYTQKFKK